MRAGLEGRRIGRFTVANQFLLDATSEQLDVFFKGVVVIDVQRDFVQDTVTYKALCDQFAPVRIGELIPEYVASITDDGRAEWSPLKDA